MTKYGPVTAVGLLAISIGLWAYSRPGPSTPVRVVCATTKGEMEIAVEPAWSPLGATRFLQMVDDGYFVQVPFFRCMDHFICQFGPVPPRPQAKVYPPIQDDPPQAEHQPFKTGFISFAGSGPNSRANHIFVALADVKSLGTQPWETPFGYVTDESMRSTVIHLNTSYGDTTPIGHGPEPTRIAAADGAEYLSKNFPSLDYIVRCSRLAK